MPTPSEQLAALQAQLQALQARPPGGTVGGGGLAQRDSQAAQQQWLQQQYALNNQIQALNNAQGSGANADRIGAARDEAYGLARGAVSQRNPIDEQVLAALQQRSGADGGPYNAATTNALMTQATDTAGQIALNSKNRIQGSAGDPSVIAANNEADARRLADIQRAQLGISTQANLANYDARGQALGQLGGYNQAVQGNQRDNERYLINMLTREMDTQDTGVQAGMPTFTQYSQPQAQPQVQPTYVQPTYQPQPTTAPAHRLTPANGIVGTPVGHVTVGTTGGPGGTLPSAVPQTWTATGSAGTRTGQNPGYAAPQQPQARTVAPVRPIQTPDPRFGPVRTWE